MKMEYFILGGGCFSILGEGITTVTVTVAASTDTGTSRGQMLVALDLCGSCLSVFHVSLP